MADVDIEKTEGKDGWNFAVKVRTADGTTQHAVGMTRRDFDRLRGGKDCSPEAFVRASFAFLLERESNRSILGRFDITVIGRYFPEFSSEIVGRL